VKELGAEGRGWRRVSVCIVGSFRLLFALNWGFVKVARFAVVEPRSLLGAYLFECLVSDKTILLW